MTETTTTTPAETVPPDDEDDAHRDSPTPGEPAIDGDAVLDDTHEDTADASADVDENDEQADEPTIDEVELDDGDFGFSGDDRDREEDDDDASADADESETTTSDRDPMSVSGTKAETIEDAVNEGYARLLVVGIDDEDEKEQLEQEFAETFEAFRLGACASRFADEYIFTPGEDVDPAWALLGVLALSTAFATWMRPDGDEQVAKLTSAISGLLGTGGQN